MPGRPGGLSSRRTEFPSAGFGFRGWARSGVPGQQPLPSGWLQQPRHHCRRGQYCDMSASPPGTWTGTDTPGEIRPGKATEELCEEGMRRRVSPSGHAFLDLVPDRMRICSKRTLQAEEAELRASSPSALPPRDCSSSGDACCSSNDQTVKHSFGLYPLRTQRRTPWTGC